MDHRLGFTGGGAVSSIDGPPAVAPTLTMRLETAGERAHINADRLATLAHALRDKLGVPQQPAGGPPNGNKVPTLPGLDGLAQILTSEAHLTTTLIDDLEQLVGRL